MKFERPLSSLYQLYIEGNLARSDFEGRIFQYLLGNFERYRIFGGNRDHWDEFLSWLYPRLVRAIDLYRDMGSSFDTYIAGLIHSAAREYRCREADHRMTEHACWRAKAEEIMLFDSDNSYFEALEKIPLPKNINSRQVLFLLLKSYFFASDDLVNQVAEAIGMKSEVIHNMVDELRKKRSAKEEEILDLRERLHCQYYRCLAYQKRMSNAQGGTEYYERMKSRFERARKRYNAMRKRLGSTRISASNRMIAEVMGIPHGTVDSSLFSLKKQLAPFVKQNPN